MDLLKEIENSTSHRPIRDKISGYVLGNPDEFAMLLNLALDTSHEQHYKACWNLELVLEARIGWIQPHLETFCDSLENFTDESALRSISKICLFICKAQFAPKKTTDFATDDQLRKIASSAFDWLIDERKVATKAYSMRALFLLGRRFDWIYPDLKAVLLKDFPNHSAAYKAAARQLLLKL